MPTGGAGPAHPAGARSRLGIEPVAATGAALASIACALPFAVLRPNRLAPGESHGILAAGVWGWALLFVVVVTWALAVLDIGRLRGRALLFAAVCLVAVASFAQGAATVALLEGMPTSARVSAGGGPWLMLAAALAVAMAGAAMPDSPGWALPAAGAAVLVAVAAAVAFGGLDQTSLARELSIRTDRFWTQALEHVYLTGAGLGLGLLVGVPLGVWASRNKIVRDISLYTVSIIQTIPSLAVLGLLIAPLAALAAAYPVLAALGVRGIGTTPAVIALTLYALLPIVRNTYTGLIEVDEAARDAALGMGMSRWQLLRRVEIPLALPLLIEGVRLAAVLLVGITALTALNGAGGLGFFIFEGLNQAAPDLILLGSLPTIALAVVFDLALRAMARLLVPEGLRVSGEAAL
ncbi:MAG: ABC transporter permease [Coriobacteriia bacterium]